MCLLLWWCSVLLFIFLLSVFVCLESSPLPLSSSLPGQQSAIVIVSSQPPPTPPPPPSAAHSPVSLFLHSSSFSLPFHAATVFRVECFPALFTITTTTTNNNIKDLITGVSGGKHRGSAAPVAWRRRPHRRTSLLNSLNCSSPRHLYHRQSLISISHISRFPFPSSTRATTYGTVLRTSNSATNTHSHSYSNRSLCLQFFLSASFTCLTFVAFLFEHYCLGNSSSLSSVRQLPKNSYDHSSSSSSTLPCCCATSSTAAATERAKAASQLCNTARLCSAHQLFTGKHRLNRHHCLMPFYIAFITYYHHCSF